MHKCGYPGNQIIQEIMIQTKERIDRILMITEQIIWKSDSGIKDNKGDNSDDQLTYTE